MSLETSLPPRDLWPAFVREDVGLHYPPAVNLATELVDRHVADGFGDRPAIRSAAGVLTYRQLADLVNRIGNTLTARGVAPGDRVLMRFPNRPELAAAWLATQKIGAIGVATMPLLRARELGYILEDADVSLALVAPELKEELAKAFASTQAVRPLVDVPAWKPDTLSNPAGGFWGDVARASSELDAIAVRLDDPALIAYTSGSTGQPKGAVHGPAAALASADTYSKSVLAPRREDVFGGHPSLAFTFGLGGLLVFPLRAGASTALLDGFTPERQLEIVARERVTILFCSATTYRMLLQIPEMERRYDLSSLRLVVSAGETLPAPVYDEWMARTGVTILDGLGTTEMFHIFVSTSPGDTRPGVTGRAVTGYDVRIVDDDMLPVPRGTQGRLVVRGPTGCRYWNKPEKQRAYVRDGWNVTGDLYVEDDEGFLRYACRSDDLIISGGYNIAGPEIEAVLLEHPAVLEVAVVGSPDATRGAIVKAFVVLKPGATAGPALVAALQDHVKKELAPYKYPRAIDFLDALPKTETGKIRRVELRERELASKLPPTP